VTGRRALVSGASIAGLSAAWWLVRSGWSVTVLERAPQFRDGGQNVDVRGVAREVLDRMGLVQAVKAMNTTETGTVFVDESGRVTAELPTGPEGATAELEVLRGDFARILLDALPPDVEVLYDQRITAVVDGAGQGQGVAVTTASGRELRADLLVVAEGVRSSTRGLLFGEHEVELHDLGVAMAFGTIPRTPDDDDRWRWLTTTGGRQVHLRPDPHGTTRAILAVAGEGGLAELDRPAVVARLRELFEDAGWESRRVLDGFETSEDVYVDDLTQVRMPTWSRGRAVLAGDAAWCVTPMGGGGASLALTSGYVLAAQLSTAPDTATALRAYEDWMRPLVDEVQHLPPGITTFAYPRTRLGLAARRVADRVITSKPLEPLTAKLTQVASSDRPLPRLVA
jgi:2-polyprenyl-6-methoxyphenol hydroxylase-like FAD-dependent oxidoreductase